MEILYTPQESLLFLHNREMFLRKIDILCSCFHEVQNTARSRTSNNHKYVWNIAKLYSEYLQCHNIEL